MKNNKRLTAIFLCLLCLTALLPLSAAASSFDAQEPLSLTIRYMDGEKAVVGAPFRLYKVARLNEDLSLVPDDTFATFRPSIENPDTKWDILARTLEDYVNKNNIRVDDLAQTNATGKAVFPSGEKALTPGVYLVVSDQFRYDGRVYSPSPVIITLPNKSADGEWIYEVTANAKFIADEDSPIALTVEKKWDDKNYEDKRPKEITVILLKNGKEHERVKLNKDNDWKYTWTDLDPIYEWTVKEVELDQYKSTVKPLKKDGNKWSIEIENEYIPPKPPQLPQTGQLNWPIPLMVVAGLAFFVIGWALCFGKKREQNEK